METCPAQTLFPLKVVPLIEVLLYKPSLKHMTASVEALESDSSLGAPTAMWVVSRCKYYRSYLE
jgi:hypothetical protein